MGAGRGPGIAVGDTERTVSQTLLREQEAFMLSRLRAAAALTALASFAFGGLVLASRAHADPAALTVGTVRTPVNRQGVSLRANPRIGADVLGNLPHGTRFSVEEIQGAWIRVSAETVDAAGAKSRKTGWIKAADTVDPYALTGSGRAGVASASTAMAAQSRGFATDTGAAGRGFTKDTEDGFMQSDAAVRAAYALVDRVEEAKPSQTEVQTFAQQGRLGFPGRTR
jgi:hypothetical protein